MSVEVHFVVCVAPDEADEVSGENSLLSTREGDVDISMSICNV